MNDPTGLEGPGDVVNISSNSPPQQPHQEKKHEPVITFGSKKAEIPSQEITNLNAHVAELGRRIRIIEERYSNLRRKTQVTDQNMLTIQKTINREIKTMNLQLEELEKEVSSHETKVLQIAKELSAFAKSDDVKVLKRYTEFWEPLAFITKHEAEKIINDTVKKHLSE